MLQVQIHLMQSGQFYYVCMQNSLTTKEDTKITELFNISQEKKSHTDCHVFTAHRVQLIHESERNEPVLLESRSRAQRLMILIQQGVSYSSSAS